MNKFFYQMNKKYSRFKQSVRLKSHGVQLSKISVLYQY